MNKVKSLKDKVLDVSQPVIIYELLPPSLEVAPTSLEAYIECALDLLTDSAITIDAVNIPDVRTEESEEKNGNHVYKPKIQPGYFAQILEQEAYKHIDIILNHCTVYDRWPEQKKWLETTIFDYQIRSLVLVGGSSSKIQYPGPSVLEMCDYVREYFPDILCGGIMIQSRRSSDFDEPLRMLTKGQHGIAFFTSQIVYEAKSVQLVLRDYANLCKENNVEPKRVFLSFAPISNRSDLGFLRWLGVRIPQSVESYLFKADMGIGWRSAKVANSILEEILDYMRENKIEVPLGINIEHITRHNFELSIKFLERLGDSYYNYFSDKFVKRV